MTPSPTILAQLLERVEATTGPDITLDDAIMKALFRQKFCAGADRFVDASGSWISLRALYMTRSIDDALEVGRLLDIRPSYMLIGCFLPSEPEATADRIARRCIANLLKALIAQETDHG